MDLLNRYLCFYIFFQSVQCELGEDVILDILSSRLDHISLALAKIARKQKGLEKRIDEIAAHKNDFAKGNDQDLTKDAQEVSTSVNIDEEMKEEFSVIKRAISSEKEYLRNLVESLETEMERKIDNLNTNVSFLGTAADICKKQMGSMQTSVSSLSTTTNRLKTKVGTMETTTDNLKAKIGSMETSVSSLETTADICKKQMGSVQTSVSSLSTTTNRLKTKVGIMETTTDSLKAKIGSMETSVSSLETTADMCKKQMGSMQTSVSSLSTTTNRLKTKMGTMETTTDSLKAKMGSVETSVSSLTLKSDRKVSFSVQYRPEGNFAILGKQATIKFNKVFYNDGSGYSKTTGVFTVPVSGVYQFIFFVEGWTKKDDYFSCIPASIELKIDDKQPGVVALAEPMHVKQSVQSGNVYINYFSKGQEVLLSTPINCDEYSIFGYRTSFHGVLLY